MMCYCHDNARNLLCNRLVSLKTVHVYIVYLGGRGGRGGFTPRGRGRGGGGGRGFGSGRGMKELSIDIMVHVDLITGFGSG